MTGEPMWLLIRQDDGGNRYRVARCTTRDEAERIAGQLDAPDGPRYVIEPAAAGGPR